MKNDLWNTGQSYSNNFTPELMHVHAEEQNFLLTT
jgi:hypothetical protein